MNIEYQHSFGLPRKVVWKYIKDEKVLGNTIPNCRTFAQSKNGVYHAEIDINIGPLKDVFTLEVKLEKEQAPSYYHLLLKGKGNLGEINGNADLFFKDQQGSTQLTIHTDVKVTGILSGAAERVISGGANKGIEKFFLSVEKEIKKNLYLLRKGRK
ncbi:SRPBCC domain-containing protein [Neobacillus sp. 179-C4.2 HS]|uniref:SRPBCC domain-containing protein n=1 Tax=Neobacillus driksii TaxID=3035913 RepID=A0ABV4YST4_9BACI|nr:SRPBCC domain-containing protein [Neobacillus sp. 179.-C4.2 HS]MDP5193969.1 SRPBCC domain-containing protein [Neobacillus sp. 179.-C4.2 HS]